MLEMIRFAFEGREIRVQREWFCAVDVCMALGFGNPHQAVASHVDVADLHKMEISYPSGKKHVSFINESGVYSLILGSRLPSAKRFKHWVTSEVLPAIRKTGVYTAPAQNAEAPKRFGRGGGRKPRSMYGALEATTFRVLPPTKAILKQLAARTKMSQAVIVEHGIGLFAGKYVESIDGRIKALEAHKEDFTQVLAQFRADLAPKNAQ